LGATALGHGDAYLSPYLQDLIKKLQPCLSKIKSESDAGYFLSQQVVRDLKKFIGKKLKIKFDNWISEENIYKSGLVLKTYEMLKAKGLVFEKDGAYWLDLSKFNQKTKFCCAPMECQLIFYLILPTIWTKFSAATKKLLTFGALIIKGTYRG